MKNNKKGFTLVELVIVVAVMAVLVAVAIPTVSSITQSAKDAVYQSNCRTIESVIKLAQAEAAKTGNGVGTLTGSAIETALDNAKLGIEATANDTPTFYFHTANGAVNNTATAGANDTVYTITYGTDGMATVSPQN